MKNTKRSFHMAIFSSVLLLVFTLLSYTTRTAGNNINDITGYLMTLFFVTVVMGFVLSLLSIKENYHWKKYVGIGINTFLFILLVLGLLGNLVDIVDAFN
ncbi:hypothetical protein [uncultured Nonlabens sp.]|uniref:hypothetical protein n=1 Tax=uncultured Nonlabens sp. TaxID=859306 RepID=UPI00260A4DEE|nr:hypothetical protein [uncultured Nonlabens sp.]